MMTQERTRGAGEHDPDAGHTGGCTAQHGAVADHLACCIEDRDHDGPHVAVDEDCVIVAVWD
ncbi:hypothetical protein AB0I28_01685 [Phytomonospora sp. NPDC050363]|uniref:hypothetical protein n=1 Tax=Phytomonospora sp. NPDC050363 TaxID=3155642 RepID=UPI0033FE6F27